MMTSHMLLDEAQKVAAAVRSGKTMGTLSKSELKMAQHLASWGIDLRGAQMLADMPIERTEGSGLLLANMENWSGKEGERAREWFLGARAIAACSNHGRRVPCWWQARGSTPPVPAIPADELYDGKFGQVNARNAVWP